MTQNEKIVFGIAIAIGHYLLGVEVLFYYLDFDSILKDRVFAFSTPDYVNYWLMTYVFFAILFRFLGIIRFSYASSQGYREYCFGQLMLVALLCKEIYRYMFYLYMQGMVTAIDWRYICSISIILLIELGLLIYFYFTSFKLSKE